MEQRIREKIQQAKDEMFPGHNRIYLEALRIEIDTLNWVLNEISREIKTNIQRNNKGKYFPEDLCSLCLLFLLSVTRIGNHEQ